MIDLGPELKDFGKAIGLLDHNGELDQGWFSDPIAKLGTLLSVQDQREALVSILNAFVPAEMLPDAALAGIGAAEQWHPLLKSQTNSNLYLTVDESGNTFKLGLGGHYEGSGNGIAATLSARLPIVETSGDPALSTVSVIAGEADGPLSLTLGVQLGWDTSQGDPITLDGLSLSLRLIARPGLDGDVSITLKGLDIDGSGATDVTLDQQDLGHAAVQIVVALICRQLRMQSTVARDLLTLLGLEGSTVPVFPFTTLAGDPNAIRGWVNALLTPVGSGAAPIEEWLKTLGALFGMAAGTAVAVTSEAADTTWSLPIFTFHTNAKFGPIVAKAMAPDGITPLVMFGLGIHVPSALAGLDLQATAMLLSVPLAGTGAAVVFPQGALLVTLTGANGPLVAGPNPLSADSVRAGVAWNGSALKPLLEIANVTYDGQTYPVVDLTNATSIVAAGSAILLQTIEDLLGGSADAMRLAALIGLVAPVTHAGGPLVDLAQLGAHPSETIAKLHRTALATGNPSWARYFEDTARLLTLTGPVLGTGSFADPWTVDIAAFGPLTLQLGAWNAQTSGDAGDPQLLRIGVRARATAPISASQIDGWWMSEVVAFDLPAAGPNTIALLKTHHAAVTFVPGQTLQAAGIAIGADAIAATCDFTMGSRPQFGFAVTNFSIALASGTLTIASLTYPLPANFMADPMGTLGITAADLENLASGLLKLLLNKVHGAKGAAVGVLAGADPSAAGLQSDFPPLAGSGTVFSDPHGAVQQWVQAVTTTQSADGSDFASRIAAWAAGLTAKTLPASPFTLGDLPKLEGAGTYDDPWRLPLGKADSPADGLVWLEPAGPPTSAALGAAIIDEVQDFPALAQTLALLNRSFPSLASGLSQTTLAAGLQTLSDHLSISDGVVLLAAQLPPGADWTRDPSITAPHHQQPGDPAAVAKIAAQVAAWAAGGPYAVLLLGPTFSDHAIWGPLLTAAGAAAVNFDLRVAGADPMTIDLRGITAVSNYYSADLQNDPTGNPASLVAQIGRVLDQIKTIRTDPNLKLMLVAHSTAGIAARAYAAANPVEIAGLITLGTPHAFVDVKPVTDAACAEAVRWINRVLPAGFASAKLKALLSHLTSALDGYVAGLPNTLPQPWAYPIQDFIAGTSTAPNGGPTLAGTVTNGVPALALGGLLDGGVDLLSQIKDAAKAVLADIQAPTHLGYGVGARIDLGLDGDIAVDSRLRLDIGRVAVQQAAPEPARPAQALNIDVAIARQDGWLVGGPSSFSNLNPITHASLPPIDVRLRSAELGLTLILANGHIQATPRAKLNDAAFHDVTSAWVQWGEAQFEALLGSLFQTLSDAAPANPSVAGLLAVLKSAGVAADDAYGTIVVAAGAVAALSVDPAGYLAPKVQAMMASAPLGFTAAAGGGYTRALGNLPLEMFFDDGALVAGIRTTGGGLDLGDGIELGFTGSLALITMTPALSAALEMGGAHLALANGALTLDIPPAVTALELYPATPSLADFARAVEALAVEAGVTALIDSILDPGFTVSGLYEFLTDPAAWIVSPAALGVFVPNVGNVLDPGKVDALLQSIGQALGHPSAQDLILPGGVTLVAIGTNPTAITLYSNAPIGPITFALGVSIDAARHVTPEATITLAVPLQGTWPSVSVVFAVSQAGISLAVTGNNQTITLLPDFSGGAVLTGAAELLLPTVLDKLLAAVTPQSGPTPLINAVLAFATAIDIYSNNSFKHHESGFAALLSGNWPSIDFAAAADEAVTLLNTLSLPPAVTIALTAPGSSKIKVHCDISAGAVQGSVELIAGVSGGNAMFQLSVPSIAVAGLPLIASAVCGYDGGFTADATLGIQLQAFGVNVTPELDFDWSAGQANLKLLPLGQGTGNILYVQFLPTLTATASAAAAEQLLIHYGIPLAADLLIAATQQYWQTRLWPASGAITAGPTIDALLHDAGIVVTNGGVTVFDATLLNLSLGQMAAKIVSGLLQHVSATIALTDKLNLLLVDDSGKLGVRLSGSLALTPNSSTAVSLLFGAPSGWPGAGKGATLYLFTLANGVFSFTPRLEIHGVGAGVTGQDDKPLVNNPKFRMGGVEGYLYLDADFGPGGAVSDIGGGVEIDQLGLPLGQAEGAQGNPVASNLMGSGGDGQSLNPGVDVICYWLPPPWLPAPGLVLKLGGTSNTIVIPVHHSLGPVYIDQIDVTIIGTAPPTAVSVGIDGSVHVSTLNIGVDELAVHIPLNAILDPGQWTLDLQGLALAFSAGPVDIAGGLRKYTHDYVEYDGMLSVKLAEIGLSIVGSYAQLDGFTSIFVFGALAAPLGGTPFAFVTGLGGGGGYNRDLIVPSDLNEIPHFVLVEAIDDGGLANDPMGALTQIPALMPPKKGIFWLGAGVRFTSFELVRTVAVVTIKLGGSLEINLLGLSTMVLPEGSPIVSIQMALKATYDQANNLLSIQAQLTDQSYLFDPNCRLTGGFAFFMWFSQGQFVVTLGGYGPGFSKPQMFPEVPRLGFNWQVAGNIVIKGGSYFALTNSCVMAGGSLSATASFGIVDAWFNAYLDFLVAWDPFHYAFDAGIEVGATFDLEVCVLGVCVGVSKSISLSATLEVSGPPFHGTATIDVEITTITVSFGNSSQPPNYITDWGVFSDKYLSVGGNADSVLTSQFSSGLLPPDPPGANVAPGTEASPWKVGGEFAFFTTTRMPASTTTDFLNSGVNPVAGVNALDIAPMDTVSVTSTHVLRIQKRNANGTWSVPPINPACFSVAPRKDFFPEAMWHWSDPANLPAAARTITAVAGYSVDGHVNLVNPSQIIPISTLIADKEEDRLPLPFTSVLTSFPWLRETGIWADALAELSNGWDSGTVLSASERILTRQTAVSGAQERRAAAAPEDVFARNRQAFGFAERGLSPIAAAALRRRSAPPLVTPLSTGLSMKPVDLPQATLAVPPAAVDSIVLERPRLRTVTQRAPRPVGTTPPALRTSASRVAATIAAPRMRAPVLAPMVGARLIKVAAADAPRSTKAALATRVMRNADFGAAIGRGQQQALLKAVEDLHGEGVTLGAGALHLWDVPDDKGRFVVSGDGAVRVICADKSGAMLRDIEYLPSRQIAFDLAPGTAHVAVECLGTPPPGAKSAPAAGAVTTSNAPAGSAAAVGWQSKTMLVQLGPACFAGHGSTLRVPRRVSSGRNRQAASQGMIRASDALRGQVAVETSLPASVEIVIVLLDAMDTTAAEQGDFAIAAKGATLGSRPERSTAADRRALFYQVAARDDGAQTFTVSIASGTGWALAGVAGVRGKAAEWAASFDFTKPLIDEGAIAPTGAITVRYAPGAKP